MFNISSQMLNINRLIKSGGTFVIKKYERGNIVIENLTFVQVKKDNEKHCGIFTELMQSYVIELETDKNSDMTPEIFSKWIASMIDIQGPHDRHLELVFFDDEVIGFLYGKIDHVEHRGFIKPEYGYVMEFYVKSQHRRSGYGKVMFRRLERLFLSNGAMQMYLTTNTNDGKLFWESMGFSQTNEVSPENNMAIFEKDITK